MKTLTNFLIKTFLLILGFLLISGYIWIRFIRSRLPRNVPFEFSYLSLTIFMFLCILYLFLIFYTMYMLYLDDITSENKNKVVIYTKKFFLAVFRIFIPLITFIKYLYKPVEYFDAYVKEHSIVKPYYKKFILYLVNLFPLTNAQADIYIKKFFPFTVPDFDCWNEMPEFYMRLYITFFIVPRMILLSVFLIDIFYFQHLYYIYKFIPLGFFIFLCNYFFYSLKHFKEKQIEFLEYAVEAVRCDQWAMRFGYKEGEAEKLNIVYNCLEPRRFIQEYIKVVFLLDEMYEFSAGTTFEYQKDNLHISDLRKKLTNIIKEEIIPIEIVYLYIDFAKDYSNTIEKIKLIIYSLYFVCFTYLLIINLLFQFCITYIIL